MVNCNSLLMVSSSHENPGQEQLLLLLLLFAITSVAANMHAYLVFGKGNKGSVHLQ